MSETYCGKTCSDCAQKESLNCPGCKAGPGRRFHCDCDVAKCCMEKGHEVCDTCGFKGYCPTLQSRENQPERRKRRIEEMQRQRQDAARRAPVLGKWLWLLFWLIVPTVVAGIMANDYVLGISPEIYRTGKILDIICSVVYGGILLKISPEETRYRTAGVCALVSAAASAFMAAAFGTAQTPTWTLVILIPAAIIAVVGEYYEYTAHAIVLTGMEEELPGKWITLRKWYIICMLVMGGSTLMIWIMPVFGAILLLVSSIGAVIVCVIKLVYLYRTARAFRVFLADEAASI